MDLDLFFRNPGYSLVAKGILDFLPYNSIKTCREVSPIWKKFIDKQKSWRLRRLHSLFEEMDLLEKFPEWKKIIPHVENEMSVSDMDTLIDGLVLYFEKPRGLTKQLWSLWSSLWCPLHWAVHFGDFEFVATMIRTPFDFNTLKFTFLTDDDSDSDSDHYDYDVHVWHDDFEKGNNVLQKAALAGHVDIVKLIIKFAKEKKIRIDAKRDIKKLGIDKLAELALMHLENDGPLGTKESGEPAKKKFKI